MNHVGAPWVSPSSISGSAQHRFLTASRLVVATSMVFTILLLNVAAVGMPAMGARDTVE